MKTVLVYEYIYVCLNVFPLYMHVHKLMSTLYNFIHSMCMLCEYRYRIYHEHVHHL